MFIMMFTDKTVMKINEKMVESLEDILKHYFPCLSSLKNRIIVDGFYFLKEVFPEGFSNKRKFLSRRQFFIISIFKLFFIFLTDEYEPKTFLSRANFLLCKSHLMSFEHPLSSRSFLHATFDVLSAVLDFPLQITIEWNSSSRLSLIRKIFPTS